jgi:hypothetical protein
MRRIVAGVLGALMVLGAASCGSSGSSTGQLGVLAGKKPAQILTAANAAAHAAGSAHYVLTAVQGTQSQTISGDASGTEGQQKVTEGTQHIQVVYVGGVAYVQGDSGGLASAMGFSAAVAKTYAGKWLAVHNTDSLFKSIVQAVTLESTLSELAPSGHLTITGNATVAGSQAIGVKGGLPGPAQSGVTGTTTLYVATSKPTLPLEFKGVATQGTAQVVDTGTFSRWGKPLNLKAPTGTVDFSTVPTTTTPTTTTPTTTTPAK